MTEYYDDEITWHETKLGACETDSILIWNDVISTVKKYCVKSLEQIAQ